MRKLRRVVLGVAAALLLVAALGLLFLHTPEGRRIVRGFVERWAGAASGGRLSLGSLDYRLWAGRADASDVRFSIEGTRVEVGSLQLRWSPGAGLRVRVVRPRLVVRDSAKPRPERVAQGLAARPWSALERFAGVELSEGRVELQDARGVPYLVLGRVDGTLQELHGRRSIRLAVDDGRLGPSRARLSPIRGSGDLSLERGRLELRAVRLEAPGARALLQGSLDRLEPNEGTLRLSGDADDHLAAVFAPQTRLTGRLHAEGELALKGTPSGTLRLTSPALTVHGTGPWDTILRLAFDARRVRIEQAEAVGYGGRLAARGSVELGDPVRTALRLDADGLDVAALGGAVTGAPLPLRSRLDASLRWSLEGTDPRHGRASGRVALRPPPESTAGRPVADRRPRAPGLPLSASAQLSLEQGSVRLSELRAEAREAVVLGEVALSPAKEISGQFEAALSLAALPALFADLGEPPPAPPLVGSLRAEGELGGTTSDPRATLRLHGEGIATQEAARHATAAVEGSARYAGSRLALAPLVLLSSGGGQATLAGGVPLSPAGGAWDVSGSLESLDLRPLLAAVGVDARGPLEGRLRIDGPESAPAVHGQLSARVALAGSSEPVLLSLAGSASGSELAVERFEASLAGGRVEGAGRYGLTTRSIEARATAEGLRAAQLPLLPAAARQLDGVLAASLSLSGTVDAPAGELRGSLSQATLDGSPVPGVLLTARAADRRLELAGSFSGDAAHAGAGSPFLRGGGPLEGRWPVEVEVDTAALPLPALLAALPAARRQGATASARGRVVAELPLRSPGELRFSGDEIAVSGRLADLDWSTEAFGVAGNAQEVTVQGLRLTTTSRAPATEPAGSTAPAGTRAVAGGALSIDGRIPIALAKTFDLSLKGGLDLAALQALFPEGRAAGRAQLDLRVGGTAESPELDGVLSVSEGRGRFGALRLSGVELLARLQGAQARVERAEARLLGGRLSATGSLPMRRLAGQAAASLHFEATDLDLSRLALSGARDPDAPAFLLSVVGDLSADAPSLESLRARGQVVRLEERSREGKVGLQVPVGWALEKGRFSLSPLRLVGPLGTLEARAEATLGGASPQGSASIHGPFDLRLLGPFLPDTTLAGTGQVDLTASWGASGVRLDGGLTVARGRMTLEDLAFTASQIDGQLRLLGDRATLEAKASAGDGRIDVQGAMTFGPGLLGPAQLELDAVRVPIQYPEGFRARASGKIRVSGGPGAYRVGGEVGLTQPYYTAEFDRRKQSLDRLDWQLAALRGRELAGESLPLSVHVRLDDPLRIRNSQARLDVLGSFDATGTLAQPAAVGQVSLREGGSLSLRRARVRAQQGRVQLNGYPAGSPEVDFSGLSNVAGVEMDLHARGSFDDLQVEISSSNRPDLTQTDLLALLLTGRTAQAAAAQSGAIVAEELASALGGVLQKGIGQTLLIDVSPDRSLLTDDSDPTQRFNLGTRLRQGLTVVYSTRLDGTEQRWIVGWNPRGGRLRLRAIDDEKQGLSFEGTDRVSFDLFRRGSGAPREAPQRAKLTAFRIIGDTPLPPDELRKAARLKVGGRYGALRRERAADRVRELLVRRGYRSATVDAESHVAPGRGDSLELLLNVDAGPLVRLTWAGDDPGRTLRNQAQAAWPAYASPEAASAAVVRAVRIGLEAQGYYEAKVTQELRVADGVAELALSVTRGRKGSGVDVAFVGNTVLGREALLATLPRPGSREFFEALDQRGGHLTGEARIAYARVGYLRARVGPPRQAVDAASGRLLVTIPVRERERSRVSELVLPPELTEAGDPPDLQLRAGRPFDVTAYFADRDAIANWYRSRGWSEARVRGVLEPAGGDLLVRYQAEPGARPRMADVRIEGGGRSRERLLREAVALQPGDLITPRLLSLTRERLAELGVYRSLDVRAEPVAGRDDLRDVVVSYVERPDLDLEYGLRYNTSGQAGVGGAPSTPGSGKLQLAGALQLTNPFGWGWRLRPYAYLTTNRYTWGAALESATLFGLRLGTQLLAFDDWDNRTSVRTLAGRVRGLSVQQTRSLLRDTTSQRWHDRLRLQWGFTDERIRYSETAAGEALLAGRRAFASLSLIGDERESIVDPQRGVFWTATSELSRRGFGSDVDYVRLYGQLFAYLRLPGRLVWAQGYRAGVVPGTNPLYLLDNRFQAGGSTTVRGYGQDDLGPRTPGGAALGGQAVLVLNQELRFPIWKQLAGGVFWDAGNVWALARDFSPRDLRQDVGAGLRLMLPFGPVRVEYAFVLNRRPGESRGRVVFGLGHAF
jgi:outer membrane protein assembly factor BamA/autotransporter translocation and assembly factor TamB